MYSLEDFLRLAAIEQAEELWLHVGKRPTIVLKGQIRTIGTSEITSEDTEHFLLKITDTRQRRQIRSSGRCVFFHIFQGKERFLVRATAEQGGTGFVIQ
jgi:Tfp pilus assembly ATPase PilU